MISLTISFLFSWYLTNFVRTDSYGPLAAMMGFLLWTWISVQVILMGAELNAEIEHQTAIDTTTGLRIQLVVGVLGTDEPNSFLDPKTRELVGYEVDLGNAVAKALGKDFSVVDSATVVRAYARAGMELARDPWAMLDFQMNLWKDGTRAWAAAWQGRGADSKDRRFRDARWNADPVSRGLRDVHLAVEQAAERLLETLPRGDKNSLRVKFYTRQLLSALSPSNYLALNPAARDRFLETE